MLKVLITKFWPVMYIEKQFYELLLFKTTDLNISSLDLLGEEKVNHTNFSGSR